MLDTAFLYSGNKILEMKIEKHFIYNTNKNVKNMDKNYRPL